MSGVSIACADLDGDTLAEVSTCVSWKNNASACMGIEDTVPGTKSKCQCSEAQLDSISIPDLSLTKSCTPDIVAPGGTVACTITISNSASAGTAQNLHFEDDYPQTYGSISDISISSGNTATDDGDIIDIQTGDILPGETITLTYNFNVNDAGSLPAGTAEDTFTNTVEAYYTNSDGIATAQGLAQSDTTTVPVTVSYFTSAIVEGIKSDQFKVQWQTQTETANIGFNVLAKDAEGGLALPLNDQLIPSKAINSSDPLDYEAYLRVPFGGAQIILQAVDVFGNIEEHGPYEISETVGARFKPQPIEWNHIRSENKKRKAA